MSYQISRCLLVCVLFSWLLPVVGRAQINAEPGTVSGIGSATVKQKPVLVRMTVQLEGKGKTVKEAMNKLKDRREAAVLQLQSLGAKKESIVVSDPSLTAGESDQQRQMQRVMIQQMRASGRAPKAVATAKTVSISSTVTAEWPLTAKTPEELLTFADELQNKVEAADLAGLKEPKKLTPEETELQEELAQMSTQYGYDENQPKPGVPQFAYVARVSEQEREKALAEAFEKAKRQAEKLAAAAGAHLGNLSSINGTTSQANEATNYGMGNAYAMQMLMAQQRASNDEQGNEDEGLVAQPGMVTFQVMVTATFALK